MLVLKIEKTPRHKLIQLRREHGLKQKDLAVKFGITTSYYGMIELGTRNPSLELAQQIADYFGETVKSLFFNHTTNEMLCGSLEQAATYEAAL